MLCGRVKSRSQVKEDLSGQSYVFSVSIPVPLILPYSSLLFSKKHFISLQLHTSDLRQWFLFTLLTCLNLSTVSKHSWRLFCEIWLNVVMLKSSGTSSVEVENIYNVIQRLRRKYNHLLCRKWLQLPDKMDFVTIPPWGDTTNLTHQSSARMSGFLFCTLKDHLRTRYLLSIYWATSISNSISQWNPPADPQGTQPPSTSIRPVLEELDDGFLIILDYSSLYGSVVACQFVHILRYAFMTTSPHSYRKYTKPSSICRIYLYFQLLTIFCK